MVLFRPTIVDGLPKPCRHSISIWAVDAKPLVVLVEIVKSDYGLELFLQVRLNLVIETAKIIIQVFAKLCHILFVQLL